MFIPWGIGSGWQGLTCCSAACIAPNSFPPFSTFTLQTLANQTPNITIKTVEYQFKTGHLVHFNRHGRNSETQRKPRGK